MSKDQSKQWWHSAEKFVKDLALRVKMIRSALEIPNDANGFISEACNIYFNPSCVEDAGSTFELKKKHQNATNEATQVGTYVYSSHMCRYSCVNNLLYQSCAYIYIYRNAPNFAQMPLLQQMATMGRLVIVPLPY